MAWDLVLSTNEGIREYFFEGEWYLYIYKSLIWSKYISNNKTNAAFWFEPPLSLCNQSKRVYKLFQENMKKIRTIVYDD